MDFASLLDRFRSLSALVIGDLMLDEYLFGENPRMRMGAAVVQRNGVVVPSEEDLARISTTDRYQIPLS